MSGLKPLFWVRGAKRDYRQFPIEVQEAFGFELFLVQGGQHPPSAKRLAGLGSGVLELVEDAGGGTYRTVYAIKFRDTVYVLHAFKKKSKRGISTPKTEIELVRRRLKDAEEDYAHRFPGETIMARRKVEVSDPNIFADLGLPDAQNHLLKARLVAEVYRLTKERGLNQTEVGRAIGITQPEVSRLFKGHFREYSIERLMGFLTRLDRDVEILIHPTTRRGKPGKIIVTPAAA